MHSREEIPTSILFINPGGPALNHAHVPGIPNGNSPYQLRTPLPLKAGTVAPWHRVVRQLHGESHHPNPNDEVRWGDQTQSRRMMVGFFDVAVAPDVDNGNISSAGNNSIPTN